MGDPFVPEADGLDQEREVVPAPEADRNASLEYPRRIPVEAPDADVLEQTQSVSDEDDEWGDRGQI
jgi:hypothetical protein